MTTLTTPESLTHRPPRIDFARFKQVLKERQSPALGEAGYIWDIFIAHGVDPSFALGQFHVESLMGKSGHATKTHSWGNMLWDRAWTSEWPKYAPGNGYVYASYPNWTEGAEQYAQYLDRYAATIVLKYSNTVCDTIDEACARWQGDGDAFGVEDSYVRIIVSLMNDYIDHVPGVFIETGDGMIFSTLSGVSSSKRYFVANGTTLYRGTNGDVLKKAAFNGLGGNCRFIGPVGQKWSDATWAWGAVIVNVLNLGESVVYIKNPDKAKVTSV